jgi:hypothetical protein
MPARLYADHFLYLGKSSSLNSTACSRSLSNCIALVDSRFPFLRFAAHKG